MGTIFSYYMKRSEYETLSETQKDAVLLHAMVIEDKDCENLEDSPEVTLLSAEDFKEMTKDSRPEDDENAQCTALNQTAATTFCYDNTSLTFTYDHAKSGLAFIHSLQQRFYCLCGRKRNTSFRNRWRPDDDNIT